MNTNAQKVTVGVGLVIPDNIGRILFEKRSDNGLWGLPGGRIDPGESAEQTAKREALEETGFCVEVVRLIGVYSHPAGRIVTYREGDIAHKVDIIVEARIVGGTLLCSDESEAVQFFERDQIPQDLVPTTTEPLQDFLSGRYGILR